MDENPSQLLVDHCISALIQSILELENCYLFTENDICSYFDLISSTEIHESRMDVQPTIV